MSSIEGSRLYRKRLKQKLKPSAEPTPAPSERLGLRVPERSQIFPHLTESIDLAYKGQGEVTRTRYYDGYFY